MPKSKYTAQAKHISENYVKFGLNLRPEKIGAFKFACAKNNTTPTTEIKKFIDEYINTHKDS